MLIVAERRVITPMANSNLRRFVRLIKSQVFHHLAVLALLAGCSVGPDFKTPSPPDVQNLTPGALKAPVAADGQAQRFLYGLDIPGAWWKLFQSRDLSRLMERALRDNNDLKSAQATLRVAHANYEAQRGALFPVINANYLPSRQKVATADFFAPTISGDPFYTLHTGQLTISYIPDVFGGIRRQVEASSAQQDLQRFMLEATYLTLTSNIALAAVQEASLDGQIKVTSDVVRAEETCSKSLKNISTRRK